MKINNKYNYINILNIANIQYLRIEAKKGYYIWYEMDWYGDYIQIKDNSWGKLNKLEKDYQELIKEI